MANHVPYSTLGAPCRTFGRRFYRAEAPVEEKSCWLVWHLACHTATFCTCICSGGPALLLFPLPAADFLQCHPDLRNTGVWEPLLTADATHPDAAWSCRVARVRSGHDASCVRNLSTTSLPARLPYITFSLSFTCDRFPPEHIDVRKRIDLIAMPGLPGMFPCSMALSNSHRTIASIDLDECIERLYRKELLADSVIEAICAKAKELLMKESNVVHIAAPVTVVGDIHGQFFDMIEIFKIGGFCPNTNYLFLGRSDM